MRKTVLRILLIAMTVTFGAFLITACGEKNTPPPQPASYRVVYADGADDEQIAVPTDANNYAEGDTVTVKAKISRSGYNFTGWSDGTSSYQEGDTFAMPARNVVLTAGWAVQTYAVTYSAGDADGAEGLPAAAQAPDGAYNLPQTEPTCAHKRFLGWKVNGDDTLYKYGGDHASYTVAGEAVEFVAQWADLYTVTYEDGVEEETIDMPAATEAAKGDSVTLEWLADDARPGYLLIAWTYNDTDYHEDDAFTMPAENVTFTAVWGAVQTLTFEDGVESEDIEMPPPVSAAADTTVQLPAMDTHVRDGYLFAGWSDGEETYAPGADYVVPSSAKTLTAQWVKSIAGKWTTNYNGDDYTLMIVENGEGEHFGTYFLIVENTYGNTYSINAIDFRDGKFSMTINNYGDIREAEITLSEDSISIAYYESYEGPEPPVVFSTHEALSASNPADFEGTWHGTFSTYDGPEALESGLTIGAKPSFSRPSYTMINKSEFKDFAVSYFGEYCVLSLVESSAYSDNPHLIIITKTESGLNVVCDWDSMPADFTEGSAPVVYVVSFVAGTGVSDAWAKGNRIEQKVIYPETDNKIGTLPVVGTTDDGASDFVVNAGCTFLGWYINCEVEDLGWMQNYKLGPESQKIDETYEVTGNITVVAIAEEEKVDVDYSQAPTVTFYASESEESSWQVLKDEAHFRFEGGSWYLLPIDSNEAAFENGSKNWIGWWYYGLNWMEEREAKMFTEDILIRNSDGYGDFYNESYKVYALWEGESLPGEETDSLELVGTWTTDPDSGVTAQFVIKQDDTVDGHPYYGLLLVGSGTNLKALFGGITVGQEPESDPNTYTFLGASFTFTDSSTSIAFSITLGSATEATEFTFTSRTDNEIGVCYPDESSKWTYGEGEEQHTFYFNTSGRATIKIGSAAEQGAFVWSTWNNCFAISTRLLGYPNASDITFVVMQIDNTWYAINGDGAHALTSTPLDPQD